jgi:hypothetical protein
MQRELYGLPYLESVMGADQIQEIEKGYQQLRGDFQETLRRARQNQRHALVVEAKHSCDGEESRLWA